MAKKVTGTLRRGELAQDQQVLSHLHQSLAEATDLIQESENLSGQLKAAETRLRELQTERIPEMMMSLGLESLNREGWDVKLSALVEGSLPKEPAKRAAAIKWLEENEAADLIKTTVTVTFKREEYKKATKLAEQLKKKNLDVVVQADVHSSTLKSWARERLERGEKLATDVLGLFIGKIAKFKNVVEKKGGKGNGKVS